MNNTAQIAVVLPSYRVKAHILDVIGRIGPECQHIYVVDDACPEGSGDHVKAHCADPRVRVLTHEVNQGVGGAVMTGYRQAVIEGCDVVVKIDGDGQMAPELLPQFVAPILEGYADYTKGNRFFDLTQIRQMPGVRLFGNAVLSFMSKFSSGYWDIFDPTNGYTAIHTRVVEHLPLDKISSRYFFESDMLFRLNTLRCVVVDIPMDAVYGDEKSGLKIKSILLDFLWKHVRNYFKRIFYNYFLRDLSAASMQLVLGLLMLLFGVTFGFNAWHDSSAQGIVTPAGTVMVAALPVFVGLQLLLSFLTQDIQSVPRIIMHKRLAQKNMTKESKSK